MSVDKFIDENMGADNQALTPLQAAQMLELALSNGDTAQAESIEPPADTVADDKADDAVPNPADDKANDTLADNIDETNAVLLARDGVHTIPFEQLTATREEARLAKEAEAQVRAELEALKQQYQSQSPGTTGTSQQEQNEDTAQAAIDAGVDPSIFGDFDEEGIASGIEKLVQQRLAAALAPIEQQKQEAAVKSHWETIFDAHSDADSVVESAEFDQWRQSQPSFALAAIDDVLQKGTAPQIVELLDSFKRSTNTGANTNATDSDATAAQLKAKAQEVIKNTKAPIPTSLSDMPGRPGPTSIAEQVKEMGSVDALNVMAGWTPEQINQHLNSI